MNKTPRFLLSVLTVSVILLSACSGAPGSSTGDNSNTNGSSETPVIPENGNSTNSNDANSNDANSNDANSNDANSNDVNGNGNGNSNDNASSNSNDPGSEVFGVVEALTKDTITINGVDYQIADFTEFKDAIVLGNQVKIHVIVNADGSLTIREIELSDGLGSNDNSNGNNGNGDNSNNGNGGSGNDNGGRGNDNGGGGNDNGGGGNDNGGGGGNDNGGGGNGNG